LTSKLANLDIIDEVCLVFQEEAAVESRLTRTTPGGV